MTSDEPPGLLLTWDDEEAPAGCVLESRRVAVGRSLLDWYDPHAEPLELAPMSELDTALLQAVLTDSPGAPSLDAFLQERATLPGGRPELWRVLHHEGLASGLFLPRLDATVGSLEIVGLVGGARGRGLGVRLHAAALTLLRVSGARVYLDEAAEENAAMRHVFARNGCIEVGVRSYWQRA